MRQNQKPAQSSARASLRQGVLDRPDLDADSLARVQHILGYKAPETTLAFCTVIDEGRAIDCWRA